MAGVDGVVRVVVISDTHGKHREMTLPPGDLLIHCGDWTKSSSKPKMTEYEDFYTWFSAQTHESKVLISGNKEIFMDSDNCQKYLKKSLEVIQQVQNPFLESPDIIYLCDSYWCFEKNGVKMNIWGSPWTITNGKPGKAFQVSRKELLDKWKLIPSDTNLLVTHSPALGILDTTKAGETAGCPGLKDTVERIRPSLHVFGHIHESHGIHHQPGPGSTITSVNAANLDLTHNLTNTPVVLDISPDLDVTIISGS